MDPVATLRSYFGHTAFRPGQEDLVRAVLSGRDALGILPTGGGKSICYQVPALLLPGLTLVVSPLVSLMTDQVERARKAGLTADLLTADRTPAEREQALALARAGQLRLLLVSPERLAVPRFRALLPGLNVSLLAVDEAHCISEWGHDFRPSYLELGAVRARLRCPLLALTATATPRVRAEIVRVLALRDPVRVVGSFDRPNLSWHVVSVRGLAAKRAALRAALRESQGKGTALVYAGTRRTVEAVRDHLAGARAAGANPRAGGLHGRTRPPGGRHERVRYGGGPGGRAARGALAASGKPRGILPGGWPGRSGRRTRALRGSPRSRGCSPPHRFRGPEPPGSCDPASSARHAQARSWSRPGGADHTFGDRAEGGAADLYHRRGRPPRAR